MSGLGAEAQRARVRAWLDRQKALGRVRVVVWVPAAAAEKIREAAKKLRQVRMQEKKVGGMQGEKNA